MENFILTEKQKEENCDHLIKKLYSCIKQKNAVNSGSINLSFPHNGIGMLNCKKYKSYDEFLKNSGGKTITINQRGHFIENKHLLEYCVNNNNNINAVLDDDAFLYFSSH